jgi:ABC-type sugar transport system substrate-binding protein
LSACHLSCSAAHLSAKIAVRFFRRAKRCQAVRAASQLLGAGFLNEVRAKAVGMGEDSPESTYDAVRGLLKTHPKLDAIYNVAGGNLGLAQAIRESGRADSIEVMTYETNHITAPLIREGIVHYAISQTPADLLRAAMTLAGEGRNIGLK